MKKNRRYQWALILFFISSSFLYAKEIMVSAAISLKEAFTEIASEYEKTYPENKIIFNFGGSGILMQQILHGAPVDLFASADQQTMEKAAQAGLVIKESIIDFTQNQLVLITAKGSSIIIDRLEDLKENRIIRIALGNPKYVPAGLYAMTALEDNQLYKLLELKFIYTQNVRQVLEYVINGQVDIGFIYQTDALLMPDAVNIVKQVPLKYPIHYPLAIVKKSKVKEEAEAFRNYILSPTGQNILEKYGFISIE